MFRPAALENPIPAQVGDWPRMRRLGQPGWPGKIANRQSLAFSERSQLSQAIPQFHVERMLNE